MDERERARRDGEASHGETASEPTIAELERVDNIDMMTSAERG
jgi:hypothetical protein